MAERRTFHASAYWRANISGGVLAGIGSTLLLLTVFGVALWLSGFATEITIWFVGIILNFVGMFLLFYPGNLVAMYPLAVEIGAREIVLIAPWKKLSIPIEDLRDVRHSIFYQGHIVRFRRRHRLLKSFVIPWYFGSERRSLAYAIEGLLQAAPHEN